MTTALQMKLCCTAQLIQAICLIGVCGLAGNHSKHQLPQLCCVKKNYKFAFSSKTAVYIRSGSMTHRCDTYV